MKRVSVAVVVALVGVLCLGFASPALALGGGGDVRIRVLITDGSEPPYESAARRMAWEVQKRTSVDTSLAPEVITLRDPALFETPLLYWTGRDEFAPLAEADVLALRRFVEFGGFVFVDDARPESGGFGRSVRRELLRAFPTKGLKPIAASHTVYHSFYLLDGPAGRVGTAAPLFGLDVGGRFAVIVSASDVGGAVAKDNLGAWEAPMEGGGEERRELAVRLAVNLVLYALCLDYKDDQVHAPFIMRRRGRAP
jgi:hypothetical protein